MAGDSLIKNIKGMLLLADVKVNGGRPWDIVVHNDEFYSRVLSGGSLALGESYMDGLWDCDKLDEFFNKLLRAELDKKVRPISLAFPYLMSRLFNSQRKSKAFEIGEAHYDIGNDLYSAMLDSRMTYTCGYWKTALTLDEAQEAKLDLVCKKIGLEHGMRILDIGCGWGSFAKYAAEKYGAKVIGITVSREQVTFGRKLCQGLPVKILLQDYRDISGKFDSVVSLGMFEHVGYKNYRKYMEVVNNCLEDSGLFLLHTIGGNQSATSTDPWINKYIFPNSMLPSIKQIGEAVEGLFVMEDWHNFSADYDKTLMSWFGNFEKNWKSLKSNYGERFYRMWKYYLLACAGTFRSRRNQLWQIVLSKNGVSGGYESLR